MPHLALRGAVPISIHAPHEGERPLSQSTAARGHTISIHAPHEGERRESFLQLRREIIFQSTLPTRGSDCDKKAGGDRPMNFNPRSPRGGATYTCRAYLNYFAISIHAPHEGERPLSQSTAARGHTISIHAPHEGERRESFLQLRREIIFQSTLPTRGSDTPATCKECKHYDISIHAPHEGERLLVTKGLGATMRISIHAPHEGERQKPPFRLLR